MAKNRTGADEIALTRDELARLSGFRLPKAAVRDGRREVVPALTVGQLRTLDKYGLFDAYAIHLENEHRGGPLVTWTPRRRVRGIPRFYHSVVDVATARLAAWMLSEGLTYTQVVVALRTQMIRAVFGPASLGPLSDSVVVLRSADAGLSSWRNIHGLGDFLAGAHLFPLAWLQVITEAGPRIQKMVDESPEVWRHAWVSRAEAAMQARA